MKYRNYLALLFITCSFQSFGAAFEEPNLEKGRFWTVLSQLRLPFAAASLSKPTFFITAIQFAEGAVSHHPFWRGNRYKGAADDFSHKDRAPEKKGQSLIQSKLSSWAASVSVRQEKEEGNDSLWGALGAEGSRGNGVGRPSSPIRNNVFRSPGDESPIIDDVFY